MSKVHYTVHRHTDQVLTVVAPEAAISENAALIFAVDNPVSPIQ